MLVPNQTDHSLGRWGSIKSVGLSVEKEDGVAEAGLGPVLSVNSKVGFSFEFCNDFPILIPQHSFRMIRLQACPGEALAATA